MLDIDLKLPGDRTTLDFEEGSIRVITVQFTNKEVRHFIGWSFVDDRENGIIDFLTKDKTWSYNRDHVFYIGIDYIDNAQEMTSLPGAVIWGDVKGIER